MNYKQPKLTLPYSKRLKDKKINFNDKNQILETKKWYEKLRFFFIPFEKIKIRSSIFLLVFLAFMLAIRIGLGYLTIPIKAFGFSISFSWLPVYIVGWFYGPIVGLFFGFASDTIDWLLHGSLWFWMYAIQEPLVGLISGFFGSSYKLFKNKSFKIQFILLESIISLFIIFIVVILITQFNNIENNHFQEHKSLKNEIVFISLIAVVLFLFCLILVIQNIKMYRNYKHKLSIDNYLKYIYISCMIIFNIALFSFLLGPIINVEYLKFLNGYTPNSFLKYGIMYYLIPRVLKESIKTPIYIILAFYIISAIGYGFERSINNLKNSWKD